MTLHCSLSFKPLETRSGHKRLTVDIQQHERSPQLKEVLNPCSLSKWKVIILQKTQQKYATLLRVQQQLFPGRLTHLDLECSRRLGGLAWPLTLFSSTQKITTCLTLTRSLNPLILLPPFVAMRTIVFT